MMSNDRTNAERQARWRARRAQAQAAIAAELAELRELRNGGARAVDVARLEAEVTALRGALARERKRREAAEAKVDKPASPPTEDAQRLMAQVERLKASNQGA